MVETSSNNKSSAMCGRNMNEQKVEYIVSSKHSRTESVGRNIVEPKAEYNVLSKHRLRKSQVPFVVET